MSDSETSAETLLADGFGRMRQAYYSHIRETVDSLRADIISGEIDDREALSDRIHSDCDSTQWTIYTFKAQCVLMCSDSDDYGIDELGVESFDWSAGIPWSQLAYWAQYGDIMDSLDSVGIDDEKLEAIAEFNLADCTERVEIQSEAQLDGFDGNFSDEKYRAWILDN
ncbi:MAG: hypothetical protein MJA29_08930 [Candidatus Omnitrophica bacterium]|nr:hypothetical protein [Candidatus Omnitrophota bacterium]